MSKHHHQSREEQVSSKVHDEAVKSEDGSIQLRAYQIHQEKGGSDLDNWLEAERNLKNGQLK